MNALVLAALPAVFALGAVFAPAVRPLRWARWVSLVAAALLVALGALAAVSGVDVQPGVLVRADLVTWVMLSLVSLLGVVVVRYSETYLDGEPALRRYTRALLGALAAVTTLVLGNDLALIGAAWMVTSFALHQLLTFYADRPAALLAAHKKFLLSRLADVSVLVAVVLVGNTVGSLRLDALADFLNATSALPFGLEVAAVLLVIAVCLKSAQLPFHGWLTQVMEAPTPVSALLHAGVVNLGGVVLLRIAGLVSRVPAAQWLLVGIGLTTAVVAGLVMMTRVSVKLSLAWSTCAQLGFMLVQCGLGAWHLALLHLVAHSLYKAHAFLSSGTTVDTWRRRALAPESRPSKAALALIAVAVVSTALGLALAQQHSSLVLFLAVAPVLASALVGAASAPGFAAIAGVALRALALCAFLVGWHALTAEQLAASPASTALTVLVALGLLALVTLQLTFQLAPTSDFARALQPRLFSGFALDERFTRWLFKLWPPTRAAVPPAPETSLAPGLEAR
jgi:NAD(P)H-quinone oxidoreductase subunit 5